MDWHIDDVLYDPAQVEVVFTIDNSSDCKTMWEKEIILSSTNKGQVKRSTHEQKQVEIVETEPNSAIILQAGGVRHCVSSLKYERRSIIKCVFTRPHSKFLSNNHVNQFASTSQGKGKGIRKKKRVKRNKQ